MKISFASVLPITHKKQPAAMRFGENGTLTASDFNNKNGKTVFVKGYPGGVVDQYTVVGQDHISPAFVALDNGDPIKTLALPENIHFTPEAAASAPAPRPGVY